MFGERMYIGATHFSQRKEELLYFLVGLRHIFKKIVTVLYIKRDVGGPRSRNFIQFFQDGG